MDDQPLIPAEPGPAAAPEATPETAPPATTWQRMVALLGIGILVGLGAGWLLFRDAGPGAPRAAAPGDAPRAESHGVDVTNDPVLGPDDAPVTIVEFSDFDCPFCSRFATETAPRLRAQYGDRVRWVFLNYPLRSIHPRAYEAALAGECAHEQDRFWEWYDAMFSGRYDTTPGGLRAAAAAIGLDGKRFHACLNDAEHAQEVAADMREAEKFSIFGTPTFFINGRRLEGAQPAEAFAAVIDQALADES